ncbi:MAG: PIN domain-containing protein [Firmicutes bacterium]|nr:PIN domain-containing protein [Bacillota bacterium]
MKKLKIFLDTSVVSYLDQPERLEKMEDTLKLWNLIKFGKYDVVISDVLFAEIDKCEDEKKAILYDYLSKIDYERIKITDEIKDLANEIIEMGILSEKHLFDCLHIATAIISDCNIIVSWNFSHMVNVETINGIRTITFIKRFNTIDIYSPNILLAKGEGKND